MPYIIQSVFILLSPALFSASIYVILGRIVRLTDGDTHILIKRRYITRTFVTGDLVCLFMQCAGRPGPHDWPGTRQRLTFLVQPVA